MSAGRLGMARFPRALAITYHHQAFRYQQSAESVSPLRLHRRHRKSTPPDPAARPC
jgi:hypothetical protein